MHSENGALPVCLGCGLYLLTVVLAVCRDRFLDGGIPAPLPPGPGSGGIIHRVLRLPL
jgi:hypothetical protein